MRCLQGDLRTVAFCLVLHIKIEKMYQEQEQNLMLVELLLYQIMQFKMLDNYLVLINIIIVSMMIKGI